MPDTAQNGQGKGQNKLGNEDLNCEEVHQTLNGALLVSPQLTVHHDARLAACVDHEANYVLCVLKICALEQELVVTQRKVFPFRDMHVAFKGVQVAIGGFSIDLGCKDQIGRLELATLRNQLVQVFWRLLCLQVFFAVK